MYNSPTKVMIIVVNPNHLPAFIYLNMTNGLFRPAKSCVLMCAVGKLNTRIKNLKLLLSGKIVLTALLPGKVSLHF